MEDAIPFNVLGHEDAMACQVLEIIGGIAPKALQTLEEPCKEMDVWSMEEGDDSVFYSDEDTTQEEAILEQRRPVTSEDDGIRPGEEQQEAEEIVSASLNVGIEQGIITNVQDEEEIVQIKNENEVETVNPSSLPVLETFVNTCEEAELNNIDSEADTTNNVEEKDLKADLEDSPPKITEDPVASNQPSLINLLPLEVYRESEKHPNIQDGFHDPYPSEGRSIPSLSKKKSSHPKSFNHLTSSKYSTTSYRKIRRGNTRQKIHEFEYMIMNL